MPHAVRPSLFRSISSQKDKPRLYIALYSRHSRHADCDAYHWALVVGPAAPTRKDLTSRYHLNHARVNSTRRQSIHESTLSVDDLAYDSDGSDGSCSLHGQAELLVLIAVAKVLDADRLGKLLSQQRPRSNDGLETTGCLHWVRDAFTTLHTDTKCLKSFFDAEDWSDVERCAREYCRGKRRDGRFTEDPENPWGPHSVSVYNAWERRETAV